jgi:hypothetical protein
VFAECPDRPLASGEPIDKGARHDGLSTGTHAVVIEATLAGTDRVLKATEKKIELSCGDVVAKDAGAAPLGKDASVAPVEEDAGTGAVEKDAGGAPLEKDAGAAPVQKEDGVSGSDCAAVHPIGAPKHGAAHALCLLAVLAASSRLRLRSFRCNKRVGLWS